jgi:8-oxo-dGTP pyrophosphatase MutT (NUDIX family)
MNKLLESWRRFLSINEQEIKQDSREVAKIVLVDDENRVLFLKRTQYVDKFAGEWDLPGGHVHIGESLKDGLKREVEEETGLEIFRATLFTKIDNLNFFKGKYEGGDIILSHEHSEYEFRDPMTIESPSKFEKVAQEVVKNV